MPKREIKLHIPKFKEYEMPGLQNEFCNRSNGCVDDCSTCLFDMQKLPEFITWFKTNLNVVENDKKG